MFRPTRGATSIRQLEFSRPFRSHTRFGPRSWDSESDSNARIAAGTLFAQTVRAAGDGGAGSPACVLPGLTDCAPLNSFALDTGLCITEHHPSSIEWRALILGTQPRMHRRRPIPARGRWHYCGRHRAPGHPQRTRIDQDPMTVEFF